MLAWDYKTRTKIIRRLILLFVGVICVIWIIPLVMIVSGSFTEEATLVNTGYQLIPPKFSLEALPTIDIPRDLRVTATTLAAPVDLRRLAYVAVEVKKIEPAKKVGIVIRSRGVIYLNIDATQIVLGTRNNLTGKLDALRKILEERPQILAQAAVLNLMAPDQPRVVYKTTSAPKPIQNDLPLR